MPVSQRSRSLARGLGYELALMGRGGFRRPWTAPLAYPLLAARTILAIARNRPRALVVVAPPFVAPLVVLPLARLLGARLAVDIHSGALLDRRWRWSVPVLAWTCRRSEVAIVTLPSLAARLAERGLDVEVIPDPLPDLGGASGESVPDRHDGSAGGAEPRVVAVCSWAADEPIDALLEAARGRPWRLAITGRPNREVEPGPNVELTGFVADEDYAALLVRADAVVVLTTREDTLLSGAWEAIALGRPLVLSDTAALRGTFEVGPAYVRPDPASIAAGIDAVLADRDAVEAAMLRLRERFGRANDAAVQTLARRLGGRRLSR